MNLQQVTEDVNPRLAHQPPAFALSRGPRLLDLGKFVSDGAMHDLPTFFVSGNSENAMAFVNSTRRPIGKSHAIIATGYGVCLSVGGQIAQFRGVQMSLAVNPENPAAFGQLSAESIPAQPGEKRLPSYVDELADFHRAFARELTALIDLLPVCRGGRILDAACGDGFYLTLLARELEPQLLVGLDTNAACLDLASRATERSDIHPIALVQGTLETFPSEAEFDLVWCAQSLFSLPDPLEALKQMAALVRPGGVVAVLENDSLHQALLPLPSHLELLLRTAERSALTEESDKPEQYYVGRRLPALLSSAGLTSVNFRTQAIDRLAPLDRPLERFLEAYLRRLFDRVSSELTSEEAHELSDWLLPTGASYLPRQSHFSMSWFNVLAWGRRPYGPIRSPSGVRSGPKIASTGLSHTSDGIHPDDPSQNSSPRSIS